MLDGHLSDRSWTDCYRMILRLLRKFYITHRIRYALATKVRRCSRRPYTRIRHTLPIDRSDLVRLRVLSNIHCNLLTFEAAGRWQAERSA